MRVPIEKTMLTKDSEGGLRVAPGRQLYVYERDTTTQVSVYDAPSGGSVVSQPLSSDAEGRFPSRWVAAGSYDFYAPGDSLNATQPWEAIVGVDQAGLAIKSAAETITGDWTFSPTGGTGSITAKELVPASLVTALPASPANGQIIYFDTGTAGVIWQLRYNSAAGSYKWEFIGGSPMLKADLTAGVRTTITSDTYVNLGYGDVTVPLAGEFRSRLRAQIWGTYSQSVVIVPATVANVANFNEAGYEFRDVNTTSTYRTPISVERTVVATAGEVVRVKCRYSNISGAELATVRQELTPIRVG